MESRSGNGALAETDYLYLERDMLQGENAALYELDAEGRHQPPELDRRIDIYR